MSSPAFDYNSKDSQAMPIAPIDPGRFDFDRFEKYAAQADQRYAEFLKQKHGIAVWQRVRVGEVFRDACHDMRVSLPLQLGALTQSLNYATDAPTYLEPWYGIGTSASAFGGQYVWHEGQAPAMRAQWKSIDQVPELVPQNFADVPIMRYTLNTIEYFLEQTRARVPISWTDLQAPINVATELLDTSEFFRAMLDAPDRITAMLTAITQVVIDFTHQQSELLGAMLARPGHGFASSRAGTGIGMSTDNLVMISPRMYEKFCVPDNISIGQAFGGVAIHSCGDYSRWLPALKKIQNLIMVDAAFSPQTDPNPNTPEVFRDAFKDTGIIVHARIVGEPDQVIDTAKRLWSPGMKLIIVTYVQDAIEQQRLYQEIHNLAQG